MILQWMKKTKTTNEALAKSLKVSKATACRISTGLRFKTIKPLFAAIYALTNLTPNQVLGIPGDSSDRAGHE